ncbi:MAG: flagellar hook-associated protein FlgK [Lachnospiraceae bacterium]|nr:flagellar hook-associated protein FlgK [Lachnospiraceae bacterium]
MSSTFLGLNTAYTGLQASNAALNTTANNIANVETKGYSRQQVTTQAAEAIRSFTTYGCVGAGVDTLAIERVRENFYDLKYWDNQSKLGEYEAKSYYMSTIEDYYKDDSSIKGFTTIFNEYYDTIEELSKNPSDLTYKQQMIGQANNLSSYFNDMYVNMQKLQDDVNQEIKVNIDRINSIAQEVAALNKQINVIEMNSGAVANELRDQRDLLIDELSEIVDVQTDEIPVIDNTTGQDSGGSRYLVKICGQTLVDANSYKTLTCVTRELTVKTNQTDIDGLYDVYFYGADDWTADDYRRKGDVLNVFGASASGKLAGLFQMRDGNNGENFDGLLTKVENSGGKQIITVEVDKDYLMDINKLNLTQSGGIINVGNQNYYFEDWTYSHEAGSDKAEYTFTLDLEANKSKGQITQNAVTNGARAIVGDSVAYQGIPYYLRQMNEWVRLYSSATNQVVTSGRLDDGTAGHILFSGSGRIDGKDMDLGGELHFFVNGSRFDVKDIQSAASKAAMTGETTYEVTEGLELLDADGIKCKVKSISGTTVEIEYDDGTIVNGAMTEEDGTAYADVVLGTGTTYYMLTAGNFKVTDEMIKDGNYLATRSEATNTKEGVEKNDIVRNLIALRTDTDKMSFRGCAAGQYLITVLGDVALNAQRATNFKDNYTYMQNSIQNQRLSIFGVDNDEEAVNLTKFQQQYNMASKMIQILKEVYDRLILQTGV